jgi:hypothetical protein
VLLVAKSVQKRPSHDLGLDLHHKDTGKSGFFAPNSDASKMQKAVVLQHTNCGPEDGVLKHTLQNDRIAHAFFSLKFGISIGLLPPRIDSSESGRITLHVAAS